MNILLNNDWLFKKYPIDLENKSVEAVETAWTEVNLPHDWLIFDVNNLYEDSIGYYKRDIYIEENDFNTYYLYFDGIYMDSEIFINGKKVFEWKYGYTAFYFNITENIHYGLNTIEIKVKYICPNSRWYSGAGIYRDVYLLKRKKLHIVPGSTYISTRVDISDCNTKLDISFDISRILNEDVYASITILDQDTQERIDNICISVEQKNEITVDFGRLKLWSPYEPNLYTLKIDLYSNKEIVDSVEKTIGFCSKEFTTDRGLILNGEPILLNGVCMHHDLGLLGSAFNVDAAERQLLLLKNMGCNAIRFCHNPPAKKMLDLCDQLGFLVIDEAFDVWQEPKNKFDYSRFFSKWYEKDIESMVVRDRNHVSLMMWSIGNEIHDTHVNPQAKHITKKLVDIVKKFDYRSNAKVTFASNFLFWEPTQVCAEEIDIVGYNYSESIYNEHHSKYPNWIIYGSETASIPNSRGVYKFPYEETILTDGDKQCSSLGNSNTSWGAPSFDFLFENQASNSFSLGQFIWTGFDYLGEPTPYDTKNSYFGIIDTAGFPKDSYYHFKAAWTNPADEIVLYLYPYWDFNPGQIVDVVAVSNASKVALYRNGDLVGVQKLSPSEGIVSARWKLEYEEGYIEVVAYDNEGKELLRDKRYSFSDEKKFLIKPSSECLKVGDLLFLEISTIDKNEVEVSNSNTRVDLNVGGGGKLIGLDNGDSTDYDQYRMNSRRLFSGKLLAIIQAVEEKDISVEVKADDIKTSVTTYKVEGIAKNKTIISPSTIGGYSAIENTLRKIELYYPGDRLIKAPVKHIEVYYREYPKDIANNNILWSITDIHGVNIQNAKILNVDMNNKVISIEILADGDFYLKAQQKDGSGITKVISRLKFTAIGFGNVLLDPYNFVHASLASKCSSYIINGPEGGLTTSEESGGWCAFNNLDFRSMQSNKLLLSCFSYSDYARFRIWVGFPESENSEIIYDNVIYKKSIWQTFQDYELTLKRKIKFGEVLVIEFMGRGDIHGFKFLEQKNGYSEVGMNELISIYGDQYELEGRMVKNIGNNVAIDLGIFDFGDSGASKVKVTGKTELNVNPIRLVCHHDSEKTIEILNFKNSKQLETQIFDIEVNKGINNVELEFMPGSDMTISSIQFTREGE